MSQLFNNMESMKFCSKTQIIKTQKIKIEAHAERCHSEEQQSFVDSYNQSFFVEPPPIILKSLETTDNTLNLPHSGLVLVGDNANNGYTLGEIEDETEFVSDLLELDLHSLNNNAMYQIVDANYVYQPPPPGS